MLASQFCFGLLFSNYDNYSTDINELMKTPLDVVKDVIKKKRISMFLLE